jgi:hypothetical protein
VILRPITKSRTVIATKRGNQTVSPPSCQRIMKFRLHLHQATLVVVDRWLSRRSIATLRRDRELQLQDRHRPNQVAAAKGGEGAAGPLRHPLQEPRQVHLQLLRRHSLTGFSASTLLTKLSTAACGLAASESPPEAGTLARLNVDNPASCMYFCICLLQFICTANTCSVLVRDSFCAISTNAVVQCHNCVSHEGDSTAWFALKLK